MSATEPIRYFSTNQAIFGSPDLEERISNGSLPTVGLAEAIIRGKAHDGGLFMPSRLPQIGLDEIREMRNMSYSQIFVKVMEGFFEGVLSKQTLERIADEAYTFEPYIERITGRDIIVGLDEGPTAAFKDYAAQVLFRIIEALRKEKPETEIRFREELKGKGMMSFIVATSGDTGGAMGAACQGMDKMCMFILYSSKIPGEVSVLQAKQMEEFNGNVYAIRIKDAVFDDCASLASRLISDTELAFMNPNSANSVNIGRLIPQVPYYFFAVSRMENPYDGATFSVPSGNFGNAVAGGIAMKMGAPITKLVIGVNENDVFERFYRTGRYEPAGSTHQSPSNSMNVNKPSNMMRLFQFYGGQLIDGKIKVMPDMARLRNEISAYSISDAETDRIIMEFWRENHKIGDVQSTIDPHLAVGWGAGQQYRQETSYDGTILTLRTAHPGKFPERIRAMGIEPELPDCLSRLVDKPHGRFEVVDNNYAAVKSLVLKLYEKELIRAA